MGEHTTISWTHHTSLARRPQLEPVLVNEAVADLAQRYSVGRLEAQRRIFRKRSNVVSVEVATPVVTTVTARETVPQKNAVAPLLVHGRMALTATLGGLPILVRVTGRTTNRCRSSSGTNFRAGFERVTLAQPVKVGPPLLRETDPQSSLCCVLASLERADAALGRNANLHAPADTAHRRKAVAARAIAAEHRDRTPDGALPAPFLARRAPGSVFVNRKAGPLRENLGRTFFRLGHASNSTARFDDRVWNQLPRISQ